MKLIVVSYSLYGIIFNALERKLHWLSQSLRITGNFLYFFPSKLDGTHNYFFSVFIIVSLDLQESPVIFRPELYFYDAWLWLHNFQFWEK